MATGARPRKLPAGPWQELFGHALRLVDGIAQHGIADPFWTFGGGTVLMLRYGHRRSKDIDIFVPDPQYLGHVSPRLSEVAESVSPDYVELCAGINHDAHLAGALAGLAFVALTDAPALARAWHYVAG